MTVAQENPDAIRSLLYKDDVKSRFTTMFGEMKTKETLMDNPGWNANFKLQQEANEQARWASTQQWERYKFGETQKMEKIKLDMNYAIAQMKAMKGGGGGLDTDFETADREGDINLVGEFESDLTNAANSFIGASDNFIWNAAISKIPGNQARLDKRMKQGMTKDQAIKNLLDNTAAQNKETPENFRARWGDKATVAYNNMNAQERRNNPDLEDAYQLYKVTRRNYDGLNVIKNKAEDDAASKTGKKIDKESSLGGIKSVGGIVNGKPVVVTPEDFYDIAIYLKGNQSSFGFLNDKSAREQAKKAEARLDQRGKKDLLAIALRQYGVDTGDVVTGLIRSGKAIGNLALGALSGGFLGTGAVPTLDLSQVNKVINKLGDDFSGTLKAKADALKNYYYETKNLKTGLLTGDTETDKVIGDRVARYAANYNTSGKNSSTDFSTFASNVGGKDVTYEAQVRKGPDNEPIVEIVALGGADNKRLGGMTIADDEAKRLGINVEGLYEPESIRNLRMYIQANGDQTSKGDPKEKSTYISGDSYFEKVDFANLRNTNYDAKANITYKNGLYYSNIYATDGRRSGLMTMPGVPDIRVAIKGFDGVNPQWIEALLKEQYNGR
jgi:hypothetical protein